MARTTYVTEQPVTLDGYQAVMKPSKFGYSLSAIVDQSISDKLDTERAGYSAWYESRLKNPKRSVQKPEPWEEVAPNQYKIKFSWNEQRRPPVVDTEGSPIVDEELPLYAGSQVKLAFYQQPYILKDGVTYGSSLKLLAVQVVSINNAAGIDTGDMEPEAAAELFGKTKGFVAADPNVTPKVDEDF